VKKLLLSICVLTSLLLGLSMSVEAGDTSTVNATVTVLNISLTVSNATVAYGTRSIGATAIVPSPTNITVTNNGNVTEKFWVRGDDTLGGGWTLANSQGNNQYVHRFSTSGGGLFVELTKVNQQVAPLVDLGGDVQVYLNMDLPTATNVTTQQTAPVTFVATQ
jgi:hypothetical protein